MIENIDINNLLPYEIKELIDKLQTKLKVEIQRKSTIGKIVNKEKSIIYCPHCKSTCVVKNGLAKNKLQTYKCKDCKKRFNSLTKTIFSYTHLSYEQILKFFECIRDKFSVRKTAKIVGVTPTSAFVIRHKILDTLKSIRNNLKLRGEIETDEYYTSINLKGTKTVKMPRASKPRTSKGNTKRGISSHKVCIATAIDEYDNLFLEIVGNGPITSKMIEKSLVPKTNNVSALIVDCKSSYESVAKENNWNLIQIKSGSYVNEDGFNLANINSLHSGLERFYPYFMEYQLTIFKVI